MKRLLPVAVCAAFLVGCFDSEPQSGGEDFPNTVSALGRALAQGLDSSRSWNGLDSAQANLAFSGDIADTARFRVVASRSLASSCVDTGYGGLLGPTHAYFVKKVCFGVGEGYRRDSLAFGGYFAGMDSTDVDTVFLSRTDSVRPIAGYSRSESTTDASGRGFFLLRSADTGRVRVSSVRKSGRLSELSELVTGGGADHRFATSSDNEFWTGARGILRDLDTLEWMDIRPFDPVLPVIGPGDSGLALATKFVVGAGVRKTERGVLVAFRDSGANYPRRWSTRHSWDNGAFRDESVLGPRPDSTFRPRDSILILLRAQARGDSLRQEVRAVLGPDPRDRKRDSLVSVRTIRYRSGGSERWTTFEFQSDRPVANGAEPVSGKVRVRIDFAEGTFIEFDGIWRDGEFSGT